MEHCKKLPAARFKAPDLAQTKIVVPADGIHAPVVGGVFPELRRGNNIRGEIVQHPDGFQVVGRCAQEHAMAAALIGFEEHQVGIGRHAGSSVFWNRHPG